MPTTLTKLFLHSNIIKKREQFEYKLARPQKEIVDYLDYIRYERSLLKLIKERSPNERKLVNLISQRIKGLYNQSTNRFPNRKSLWDDYFVFITSSLCKFDNSEVSAVLDNTLLHQGHHVENWLKYIKWERAIQTNDKKVRNLLMRALMLHPKEEYLHLEFLDLELTNARELPIETVIDYATVEYKNAIKCFQTNTNTTDRSAVIEKILKFKAAVLDLLDKYPFTKDMQMMILEEVDDSHLNEELFYHILAQRELNGQLTPDKNRNELLKELPEIESESVRIKRCVKVYQEILPHVSLNLYFVFFIWVMSKLWV